MNVIRASILKLADSDINFNTIGLHDAVKIIQKFLYPELDNNNIKNAISMWCTNKNEALKI